MSSAKQKEVVCEIIDVDIEEDCGDAMLIDGEVDRRGKGKEALSNFSVDLSDDGSEDVGSGDDGSDSDIQMSNDVTADDFNSNLFYGEDEWIDTYYDDITYDDYSVLESHFDQMDLPTGVEVPFPWLPVSPQSNTNVPAPSTSTSSSFQIESSGSHHGPDSSSSSLLSKSMWAKDQKAALHSKIGTMKEKIGSTQFETIGHGRKKPTGSSSTAYLSSQSSWGTVAYKPEKEPLLSLGKSKRKSRASNVNFSPHSQFPSGGTGTLLPNWQDSPLNIAKHSVGTVGFMNESAYGTWAQVSANDQNGATPVTVEPRNLDEILQNFDLFKKFDTVGDCSDHHYAKHGSSSKQAPKYWAKKIQEEWKSLEKDLPDEIFVRVYESRMDLLRAVIVGAEGTPYHDGLFFFDVFFPVSYPNVPPHVHYHSGGLRINPNLYNCGKVCLSLLNTWSGSQKEKWIPGVSTMLQVLVSIQGLILNAKPYFNEPGFANLNGTKSGEKSSLDYNESTFIYSLQTMMYTMRRPPKHFEAFVAGHFCKHARDILVSCKAYLDGAQVGCLVKGGVQDVDEGDKSCSQYFKSSLAGLITKLINTFTEIGAKDCQEFHSLAQKVNRPAPPPPAHGAVNIYKIG